MLDMAIAATPSGFLPGGEIPPATTETGSLSLSPLTTSPLSSLRARVGRARMQVRDGEEILSSITPAARNSLFLSTEGRPSVLVADGVYPRSSPAPLPSSEVLPMAGPVRVRPLLAGAYGPEGLPHPPVAEGDIHPLAPLHDEEGAFAAGAPDPAVPSAHDHPSVSGGVSHDPSEAGPASVRSVNVGGMLFTHRLRRYSSHAGSADDNAARSPSTVSGLFGEDRLPQVEARGSEEREEGVHQEAVSLPEASAPVVQPAAAPTVAPRGWFCC